jgi:hypothetical protein
MEVGNGISAIFFPGGTAGYPAHPRLIRHSVILSFCHITFKFSADNRPGPTDLVKYSSKVVNDSRKNRVIRILNQLQF